VFNETVNKNIYNMKSLNSYSTIAIQAAILITGYLLINAGLANEASLNKSEVSNYLVTETELEPITENWMIDLKYWPVEKVSINKAEHKRVNSGYALLHKTEKEHDMLIEEWMIDADNSLWKSKNEILPVDSEEDIQLEDWMLNLNDWN
jgi:hypothetical protein